MSNRGVASLVVYVAGLLILYIILSGVFHVDPISWPIAISTTGGYILGRITYRIEHPEGEFHG